MMAANNSVIEIIGEVTLLLCLGDQRMDTIALISPDVEELMIGADWLKEHNCVWSFGSSLLSIDGQQFTPFDISHRSGSRHVNADALCRRPYPCKQCDHCDQVPTLCAVTRQEQSEQTIDANEMTVKVTNDQKTDTGEYEYEYE